jgi:hypothetical protein
MFPCNTTTYKQHHEIFRANDSIDSAVRCHCWLSVQSFHSFQRLDRVWDVLDFLKTSAEPSSWRTTHAAATPLVFQVSQVSVSRKNVKDGDSPLCVTRIRSWC